MEYKLISQKHKRPSKLDVFKHVRRKAAKHFKLNSIQRDFSYTIMVKPNELFFEMLAAYVEGDDYDDWCLAVYFRWKKNGFRSCFAFFTIIMSN